jgi:hypothetical protein
MCTPPISHLPLYVLCNRTLAQLRRICVRWGTGHPELTDKKIRSQDAAKVFSQRATNVFIVTFVNPCDTLR